MYVKIAYYSSLRDVCMLQNGIALDCAKQTLLGSIFSERAAAVVATAETATQKQHSWRRRSSSRNSVNNAAAAT